MAEDPDVGDEPVRPKPEPRCPSCSNREPLAGGLCATCIVEGRVPVPLF